ncbi:hypothetical protein Dsin_022382 [Dipteronia sinensis]|uniref:DUF2921 domain-containing protein n=1 Tax=Dipteronia sinensis TaxID=43782 RepID=A0AAE0A2C3_9ROSI|nr:hypothetical protein Dsin_022382 [Dipteronia sinensis]
MVLSLLVKDLEESISASKAFGQNILESCAWWDKINPFNPNTKFVGEGTWDWKKNSLHVVACPFMKKNTSLHNSQVGDCSIRMKLRFPVIWIAPFDISSSGSTRVEISAEGIYDAETGSLCMVGCRYVGLNNQNLENDTMDCEMRVNLQFSSLNATKDEVDIT